MAITVHRWPGFDAGNSLTACFAVDLCWPPWAASIDGQQVTDRRSLQDVADRRLPETCEEHVRSAGRRKKQEDSKRGPAGFRIMVLL
jgi:hypothetical protein